MTIRHIDFGHPNVVAVIAGNAEVCLNAAKQAAQAGADVLEFRADLCPDDDVAGLLKTLRSQTELPWLVTIRHAQEGGTFSGDEAQRWTCYKALLPLADAIDCEIQTGSISKALFTEAKDRNVPSIASFHDFRSMPDDCGLSDLSEAAQVLGATVCKLAVTLNSIDDLGVLAAFTAGESQKTALATVGMGAWGTVSRVLNPLLGSCLTYGFVGDAGVVDGQLPVAELKVALSELSALNANPEMLTRAASRLTQATLPAFLAQVQQLANS